MHAWRVVREVLWYAIYKFDRGESAKCQYFSLDEETPVHAAAEEQGPGPRVPQAKLDRARASTTGAVYRRRYSMIFPRVYLDEIFGGSSGPLITSWGLALISS